MSMRGVLTPAGDAAHDIAAVSWVLFGGGAAIFVGVMLLLGWAVWRRAGGAPRPGRWIWGAGVLFPAVVLVALFAWVLPHTPQWKPLPPPGALVGGRPRLLSGRPGAIVSIQAGPAPPRARSERS